MSDTQLGVHIFRISTLCDLKHFDDSRKLYECVIKEEQKWKSECSKDTMIKYYMMKFNFESEFMHYGNAINIMKINIMPLFEENTAEMTNLKFLLTQTYANGSRTAYAYYQLNDI